MMSRLLYWLTSFMPCRIISDGTAPYLQRYYIGTLFGWQFYLHQFVGSDPDRSLHDHPWSKAYSIILSSWYFEQTRSGTRKVRWFNSLTGDTFHRVVLPDIQTIVRIGGGQSIVGTPHQGHRPQPCWTLFFHSAGNVKPWGFWRLDDDATCGQARFEPYTYEREGSQTDWWLTAKTRREAKGR